jgi:tight adherence protein C
VGVLIIATALAVSWVALLCMVTEEDWKTAAYNKVLDNRLQVDALRKKDMEREQKLTQYHGVVLIIMRLFLGGTSEKAIKKLQEQNKRLQRGNMKTVSLFVMPGYVMLRLFEKIRLSSFHKNIMEKCAELYGKKYAANKAKALMAQMLSYSIIGVAAALAVGAIAVGAGNTNGGLAMMGLGTMLVLVFVYALYDELSDRLNKRRAAISRQFPNVVSKLALLVTSGMIMDRAWRETAESQNLELYQEMLKTSEELDNLVEPTTAYSRFMDRCNTKETTKLAAAIIQNQSKGNAEIGALLKNMASDAWQERRHTAKRDSEAANSKLMIPTMLLFIAILVMLMVPVAANFSGLSM